MGSGHLSGEQLVLIGSMIAAVSGFPGLCFSRRTSIGQQLSAVLLVLGCGYGLAGVGKFLATRETHALSFPSPFAGIDFSLGIDSISAVFLLPVFVVPLLGTVYGLSYWKQAENPQNGRKLRIFYGLLAGSLGLLVVARDGLLFLFAWEVMALAAFFLVATEDRDDEVRAAGWLYLAASHFATLCLFCLFAILANLTGTFSFVPLAGVSPAMLTAIFFLALIGFGMKAGIMPMHFWLPSAHAMAPSHVSALMSGVLIKMGIYGLVRVFSLVPNPPVWWGALLIALGMISGIIALAFAIAQHDLKRLLAYSSIENIGIIFIGLGLALLGHSLGQVSWVVLGLGGALLHVWNHALFKSMLFLTAGSIIHAAHTRQINRLGGMSRKMPATSLCFLVGAVAACGLPPLNGFVSEFVLYIGLFDTLGLHAGRSWPAASFAAPALAFIGALAAACFVSAYSIIFLGTPRTDEALHAHESAPAMLVPMALLGTGCAVLGLCPFFFTPIIDAAVADWAGVAGIRTAPPLLASLAPLVKLSATSAFLLFLVGVCALWQQSRIRAGGEASSGTWGCGYAAPTARMQYTASSFGEILVKLFRWALLPKVFRTRIKDLFPDRASFETQVPDLILGGIVMPTFRLFTRLFAWSRWIQQGDLHAYLLYILATLVVLLLWR